jgi:hypothetical protein
MGPRASWAVVAALLLGVFTTWSLATARYGGPDEPGHVLRAAAVARGDLLGEAVDGLVAGFRSVEVPAALTTGDPRCFRHDRREPATCATATRGVSGVRRAASSAGTNPPWYYLAVGLPVRAVGDVSRVSWYRLAAAFWCAAALALAFVRAAPRRRVGLVVALGPAAWFLAGVVNPNALEIALAALAWVGVARVLDRVDPTGPSVGDVAWIGVPTALMILIRPVAAVAVVTMLAVAAVLFRTRRGMNRWCWAMLTGPPAAAVLATFAWSEWSGIVVRDPRAASAEGLLHRFGDAAGGTAATLRELAGSLGWAEFSAPWPLQLVWWSAVLGAGIVAWRCRGAQRVAWLVIAASVVAVPVAFETALAGRLGFIWQGRYSISTAIGLVLIAPMRWARRGWWLGAAMAAEVGSLWATLRRYTVGTNGSWLLRDERWHPGVPPFVLLGLNAVLMLALALWVAGAAAGAAEQSAGAVGDLLAHDVQS